MQEDRERGQRYLPLVEISNAKLADSASNLRLRIADLRIWLNEPSNSDAEESHEHVHHEESSAGRPLRRSRRGAWVALYAFLTPVSGVEVARQVAVTMFPATAYLAAAPFLGVAVHLVLSLLLGGIFVRIVWFPFTRRLNFPAAMATAIAALAAVWAINFLVVLPALNPGFITLLPYGASLLSKVLFGVAMAWALEEVRPRTGIVDLPEVPEWSVSGRS